MALRLVNNTSRIISVNVPKYAIRFILKQNESKPGLCQGYIDRIKDEIKHFGLTVVDDSEERIGTFSDFVKKERLENDSEVEVTPEVEVKVAPEVESEVAVKTEEEMPDAPKKRSYRRRIKK